MLICTDDERLLIWRLLLRPVSIERLLTLPDRLLTLPGDLVVRSGLTPLLEALDERHVRQEGWEERSEASAADRARLFRRAATPAIVVGGGSSWGNGTAIAADGVLKLSGFFRRGLDSAGDGA